MTTVACRLVDPSTTWLLVSTRPFEDSTIPVPAAAPFSYLSWELISTTPGSTLFATDCSLSAALLALPAAFRFGDGICWEETEPGFCEFWFSATTVPAPTAAATAATAT